MKYVFLWCNQWKEYAYWNSAALFLKGTLISLFTGAYSSSIMFSQDFPLFVTARFPLYCSRFRACYWLGVTETSTLPNQILSVYPSSSLNFTYTYKQLTGPRGWTGTTLHSGVLFTNVSDLVPFFVGFRTLKWSHIFTQHGLTEKYKTWYATLLLK